jgi:adenylate kinase
MKLILIGIQGSGKSTQGNMLAKEYGLPYLSTGHIFRQISTEKTPLGRYIKETMNAGYLIPDEKTLEIVTEYLSRPEYKKGYILDGFPRTTVQAEAFKNGIEKVIYLKVSDKEALWRLSGRVNENRADDTLVAIRKRIELFHKFTEPVIEYYRNKGILLEVDGEKSIEEIFESVIKNLPKSNA